MHVFIQAGLVAFRGTGQSASVWRGHCFRPLVREPSQQTTGAIHFPGVCYGKAGDLPLR